jgi:hypothetical protein
VLLTLKLNEVLAGLDSFRGYETNMLLASKTRASNGVVEVENVDLKPSKSSNCAPYTVCHRMMYNYE